MSTVTQEDTVAMFDKITSVMDYLRNQLVNNTELAKQVQALQQQVNDMTSQVNSVVGQNTALQEAVNVLTQERNAAQARIAELEHSNRELQDKFSSRDNDANHWYAQFQAVSEQLAQKKEELSRLEDEHLRLVDLHDKAKDQLERIQGVFGAVQAMEASNHPVPIVEEVQNHSGPQPRDPVTQQWKGYDDKAAE